MPYNKGYATFSIFINMDKIPTNENYKKIKENLKTLTPTMIEAIKTIIRGKKTIKEILSPYTIQLIEKLHKKAIDVIHNTDIVIVEDKFMELLNKIINDVIIDIFGSLEGGSIKKSNRSKKSKSKRSKSSKSKRSKSKRISSNKK